MVKIAKYSLAIFVLQFIWQNAWSQNPQYAFRVSFRDKSTTPHTLSNPAAYLSSRAIDRRAKYSIAIDSSDLPVVSTYIDSVLHTTNGVLHLSSRWQNSCVLLLEDSSDILSLLPISFVKDIRKVAYYSAGLHQRPGAEQGNSTGERPTDFDENFYGAAWSQIHLCHGEYLHQQGNMGEGKLIAVIDVGFSGVNTAAPFDSLFQQNRLLDTWNYIYDTTHVYDYSSHGTQVLSCMASYVPQSHVGTAPKAMYALYLTDDQNSEQAIEEDNFAAAAERADSLGADLITTSLGYNTFDDPADSYTYSDLDGHTTLVAKAANTAVHKGIFVVASAGNEGMQTWQHILTPGDADSAMTIGSVNNIKTYAISSGKGPNAAGVLKPNVCGQGVQAAVVSPAGTISQATGTSYATPVIAGLTACLMQAVPDMKPLQVRALIESVSDSFAAPTYRVGNGVPDFQKALNIVGISETNLVKSKNAFTVYPNPAGNKVFVLERNGPGTTVAYQLYDLRGTRVQQDNIRSGGSIATYGLSRGIYLLHLNNGKHYQVIKLLLR